MPDFEIEPWSGTYYRGGEGKILTFRPRAGGQHTLWAPTGRSRGRVEADRELGTCPFGGHHAVGQAMLADPWVQEAVRIMAARLPAEEPEPKPARKRARRTPEVT